jgi:heme exporter protein D
MEAMRDFLAMGGYASFVWSAYAVAATVLAGLSLHSLAAYRRCQRELARLQRVRPRRGSAA